MNVSWAAAGHLKFWSESGVERGHLLTKTEELLEEEGWKYSLDTGWTNWDMHIFASRWWNLRLRSMTEIYPHGRRLTRVGNFMNISTFSSLPAASSSPSPSSRCFIAAYDASCRSSGASLLHLRLAPARPAPASSPRRTGRGRRHPRGPAARGEKAGKGLNKIALAAFNVRAKLIP